MIRQLNCSHRRKKSVPTGIFIFFQVNKFCENKYSIFFTVSQWIEGIQTKEESSKLNLVSQAAGVQKKQCRQNSALIRLRFREGTTWNQDSCSMAKTLFRKKTEKTRKSKLAENASICFAFQQFFCFSSKSCFQNNRWKTVVF